MLVFNQSVLGTSGPSAGLKVKEISNVAIRTNKLLRPDSCSPRFEAATHLNRNSQFSKYRKLFNHLSTNEEQDAFSGADLHFSNAIFKKQ